MKKSGIFLLVSAMLISACGSSNNGAAPGAAPGGSQGGGNGGGAPADCASAWNAYVAANPQGHSETYSIETVMSVGGHDFPTNTSSETTTITESAADHVTTTISTHGASNSVTITQAQFAQECGAGMGGAPQSNNTVTVLDQGARSIDVPAGHFDCAYRKVKIDSAAAGGTSETIIETWNNGSMAGEQVKSVMVMTNTRSGQTDVTTTTKTLTHRS